MSIATANYLHRHIFSSKGPMSSRGHQTRGVVPKSPRIDDLRVNEHRLESPLAARKKSQSPEEIINFDELERIEKYK